MTWSAFFRVYHLPGYMATLACFIPGEPLDIVEREFVRKARVEAPAMAAQNDPRRTVLEKDITIAEALLDDPSRAHYFGGLWKRLQLHFVVLELEAIVYERYFEERRHWFRVPEAPSEG